MPAASGQSLVSQLLQVAMGFFVTISELRYRPSCELTCNTGQKLNCDFATPCSWSSRGQTGDPWTLATGSPDSLLWLAATGTMVVPSDPFSLIELRGAQGDRLMSDPIDCQIGNGLLRFRYWLTTTVEIQVCVVDAVDGAKLCTKSLKKYPIPGHANITITPPNINQPFQIGIFTNNGEGLAVVDDITYDFITCEIKPEVANNITELFLPSTATTPTSVSSTTKLPITSPAKSENEVTAIINGSNTEPLFDRRKATFIDSTDALICDFTDNFPCRWGPESGDWALALQDALTESTLAQTRTNERPDFPSAIVLPGTAMFSSDPIRCQKGPGQLILRYWATDKVSVQVCVFGQQKTSTLTICSEFFGNNEPDYPSPKQVDFNEAIIEPFTISIIPEWSMSNRTSFLIIDEIAYLADICETDLELENAANTITTSAKQFSAKTVQKEIIALTTSAAPLPSTKTMRRIEQFATYPVTDAPFVFPAKRLIQPSYTTPRTRSQTTFGYPPTSFRKTETKSACSLVNCRFDGSACNYLNNVIGTKKWILRDEEFQYPLTKLTDIRPCKQCRRSLNTQKGTLIAPLNHQFLSTILRPTQFAVLESPVFKIISENFILFQYFRPVFGSTIRMCTSGDLNPRLRNMGMPHICPVVIPELSVNTAWQWNAVYVRIPKETTQFFLIAQNNGKSTSAAVAIDNIRISSCR